MNTVKQIKIASFAITLLFSLGGFVPTAEAFFFSKQRSNKNVFSAGKIEMDLDVDKDSDTKREVKVRPSAGSAEFDYSVRAEVSSDNDFCTSVQVRVGGQTEDLSEFSLGEKRLEVGAEDVIEYEFVLPSDTAGSCEVKMIYEASQVGFDYGQAFFDKKVVVFKLSAEAPQAGDLGETSSFKAPAQVDTHDADDITDPVTNNTQATIEKKKTEAAESDTEDAGDKLSNSNEGTPVSEGNKSVISTEDKGSSGPLMQE